MFKLLFYQSKDEPPQELHGVNLGTNIKNICTNADRAANINLFTIHGNINTSGAYAWPACGMAGNLLAWGNMTSRGSGGSWEWDQRFPADLVHIDKLLLGTVCTTDGELQQPYLISDGAARSFSASRERCQLLGSGGQLYSFSSIADYHATWPRVLQQGITDEMWTAYQRAPKARNTFVSVYDWGTEMPPGLWAAGQPNNIDQHCVVCSQLAGCLDQYCTTPKPSVCQFPTSGAPLLRLHGNCANSAMDTLFYPSSDQSSSFIWLGIKTTFIRYNLSAWRWEAHVAHGAGDPDTFAYTEANAEDLLLGTHQWTVVNDRACYPGPSRTVTLSLSACHSQEFNCNDGACTHLDNRCDGLFDCSDGSDEQDCHFVDGLEDYNKGISPSIDRNNVAKLGMLCILLKKIAMRT